MLSLNDPRLKNDKKFHDLVQLALRDPAGLKKRIDAEWCAREHGLLKFIKLMWKYVEPSRPFVQGWHLDAVCEHLEAVTRGEITRLLINVPPGFAKSITLNVFWPAWEWGPKKMPSMRFMTASYSQDLTIRDNVRFRQVILSDLYREHWSEQFQPSPDQFSLIKVGNTATGWKLATSVGGLGTGERADRVSIDDPNSVKEVESDKVRDSTNQWLTEVVPTRLNDPSRSAIIIIQQRTHEEDASGIVLAREMGYEHLMIPMRYDSSRRYTTCIGWTDPRGIDANNNEIDDDGALAWPELYPEKVVAQLEKDLGPYACTPGESPVLMGDLSMKRIDQVKVGDEVIGFAKEPTVKRDGNPALFRKRLMKSRVLNVFSGRAAVVKMTLDSGEVIRCTPDHRWYRRKVSPCDKGARSEYGPAKVGSKLARICPARLPSLSGDDLRRAGWLSGFFDGEGSVSLMKKPGGFRPCAGITFYQGAGRNLPLCDLLEKELIHFNFPYHMFEFIRTDRKVSTDMSYKNRYYRLIGSSVSLFQRFLHIVQPHKWRDRIIEGALGTKFIEGRERVVSIELDGEETVYALETETGNYVVWGLASSNSSGQLQQSPVPRGGAIFERDWWNAWPIDEDRKIRFPPFEYVVASVDTAFTEKQENDYSAMTVWGVYRTTGTTTAMPRNAGDPADMMRVAQEERPKVMLMWGWQKRLSLHGPPEQRPWDVNEVEWNSPRFLPERQQSWGLVEWVVYTAMRYKIDHLLIETQAAGHSLEQELRRLHSAGDWGVELINAKGDKSSRAFAVQHLFSNGLVHAPFYESGALPVWASTIVDQFSSFPKTRHKDLVDSGTHALQHLRDTGILVRGEEYDAGFEEEMRVPTKVKPLYEV